MQTIHLTHPIDIEGQMIDRITVHDPDNRRLHSMARARKSLAGFTHHQNLRFASRLTSLGDVALEKLSAHDYANLALAIECAYQAAQGRHACWLNHQEKARG